MIYFTSDQHYGHKKVIQYCNRPFTRHSIPTDPNTPPPFFEKEKLEALELDVLDMNEELVRRHNEVVGPDDTVFHLGDFSLSKDAVRKILPRLLGKHHLIQGNHDHCSPAISKKPEKMLSNQKLYLDSGFLSIADEKILEINGRQFLMSHFPYFDSNPDYDQRYPQFRPNDNGMTLLHGHVHDCWKTKKSANGTLMINVGVDVWDLSPIPITTIIKIIEELK